jgi:polyisoprenoid-binding protein YceI
VTDAPTTPSPAPPQPAKPSHKKRWIIGGVAAALLVVAGVAIWYFVFRDDAPPAVDIEQASESVETKPGSSSGNSSVSGTWKIDNSIGSFDDFSSAFVGYRVNEELAGVGAKTATGRTPDVTGTMTIDGTTATSVDIDVDMTTLQSDESFRDGAIRNQAIETDQFPTATFELTEPVDFDSIPQEGTTVSVNATGKLTLHGVTKDVTIPLDAKLVNDTIIVTGRFDISFADYDIEKPTAARVLSIEDTGQMEMQLFFSKS